jgi:hypothetical protein
MARVSEDTYEVHSQKSPRYYAADFQAIEASRFQARQEPLDGSACRPLFIESKNAPLDLVSQEKERPSRPVESATEFAAIQISD